MAGYRAALLNFSKGVISPEIEARFDLSAYQVGLRTATNVKIRRTGGVSKRMGTRFVSECLSNSARLFPFQFSDEQGYALEFGQAYMRPLALGGAILETGYKVTTITQAPNAQVTVAYHGYTVGQQVYFTDIQGMVEINDRWLTVLTVPDVNTFTVDFDSTLATPFASDTGAVNSGPPASPPTPPVVPAPAPDPVSPVVGSGGHGGYLYQVGSGKLLWSSDLHNEDA